MPIQELYRGMFSNRPVIENARMDMTECERRLANCLGRPEEKVNIASGRGLDNLYLFSQTFNE